MIALSRLTRTHEPSILGPAASRSACRARMSDRCCRRLAPLASCVPIIPITPPTPSSADKMCHSHHHRVLLRLPRLLLLEPLDVALFMFDLILRQPQLLTIGKRCRASADGVRGQLGSWCAYLSELLSNRRRRARAGELCTPMAASPKPRTPKPDTE